ncbi:NAD(P)/FAD-dependent oxidoreductase [Paenibacillus glycanilyticus]|uniref:NAD(P)/FAD-dependent oxidoreductase n=1 Tax=Paenibacillus glycanilyticus TaxID=126569 RepID=UPI00203BA0A8|nr:NAD(P)/FAD-dependent oxidoreductase [Paenibacillus glycanilyticus]MCM3628499.1 NAD(P)/FAD-dependent oxidoreductase [Paenibacillus glycanilyticus]
MRYDVAIIGGGPAGLNAALVLGRARRTVALFDNSQPRNKVTHASHGFITRDGIEPAEFRRIAYEEVLGYPTVKHWETDVTDIRRTEDGFAVVTKSGDEMLAGKIILAAGLKEELPEIEGVREHYGKSLFACPFCDGWELRDQPLVVISDMPSAFHKVKLLRNWSRDIIVCTNGTTDVLSSEQREQLAARGIPVMDTPISSLAGQDGRLEKVHFTDGTSIERSGGFIDPAQISKIDFQEALGYAVTDNGGIMTNEMGMTTAEGVFAAGDTVYVMPSQLIYAAASGSKAAMAVMAELTEENW